jgi:alpha-beta hydrolase superfamily lysophospholipase
MTNSTRAIPSSRGNGPAAARWWWHHLLKRPFFGRFMKPWRWPEGVDASAWERVAIPSRSGDRLAALLRVAPQGRGVVVCAHPMGRAAKGFWLRHGHAQALHEAGYHVLVFDYNGFGESPSTNFEYQLDSLSAGSWARDRFPDLPVHALCASFGAMHTISASSSLDFPFDSVVAEGCAPSLPQFWTAYPAAHMFLQLLRRFTPASELRLRPVAHLPFAPMGLPLLLIHSRADHWTPVAFGDELERAADGRASVQRLILEEAHHTHGLRDERENYLTTVLDFFRRAEARLSAR